VRHALTIRALALLGACCVLGLWAVATDAMAAVPECPTAPAAYGGTDAAVGELRDARIDAAASCLAVTGRLDAQATQLDGLAGKLDAIASSAAPLHDDVVAVRAAVEANAPTGSTDAPTTVHLADADAAFVTDTARSLGGAIFLVAGLIAGVFAAGWFLRAVHR
jgi:hypothetical protein